MRDGEQYPRRAFLCLFVYSMNRLFFPHELKKQTPIVNDYHLALLPL